MVNYRIVKSDELYHHGVKGQKWGIRRYQNTDGSMTSLGKRRAQKDVEKRNKWVTSKFQPSSFKSSLLAGLYAGTGSKGLGKLLDKSNEKDRQRWENAQKLCDKFNGTKLREISQQYNKQVVENMIDDFIKQMG